MKNCHYCNAEIQENAKFCLNCMKPLKTKNTIKQNQFTINKKILLSAISFVLISAVVTVSTIPILKKGSSDAENSSTESEKTITADISSEQNSVSNDSSSIDTPSSVQNENNSGNNSQENSPITETNSSGGNIVTTPPPTPNGNNNNNSTDTTDGTITTPPPTPNGNNNNNSTDTTDVTITTPPTQEEETVSKNLKFHYLLLEEVVDEEYIEMYKLSGDLKNKIIVYQIEGEEPDGVYKIPEKIDGYTVIALEGPLFEPYIQSLLAFKRYPKSVKKVIIPKTVVLLNAKLFSGCTNLTEVYFCGEDVYVDLNIFRNEDFSPCTKNQVKFYCSPTAIHVEYNQPLSTITPTYCTFVEWDGTLPK